MNYLGQYHQRKVFCLDFNKFSEQLPEGGNWICLAISNSEPNIIAFDNFTRTSISKGILEFKGHGKYGEKIHDLFDETMSIMETVENHQEIDVMTTWHNNEILADVFWQCFHATCLPETTDLDNIKIICTDLEGIDRSQELKTYLLKFEDGWLPPDNDSEN